MVLVGTEKLQRGLFDVLCPPPLLPSHRAWFGFLAEITPTYQNVLPVWGALWSLQTELLSRNRPPYAANSPEGSWLVWF